MWLRDPSLFWLFSFFLLLIFVSAQPTLSETYRSNKLDGLNSIEQDSNSSIKEKEPIARRHQREASADSLGSSLGKEMTLSFDDDSYLPIISDSVNSSKYNYPINAVPSEQDLSSTSKEFPSKFAVDFEEFEMKCNQITFDRRKEYVEFFNALKKSINLLLTQQFDVHSKGRPMKFDDDHLAESTFTLISNLVYWYYQEEMENVGFNSDGTLKVFRLEAKMKFINSVLKWFHEFKNSQQLSGFQYKLFVLLSTFKIRFKKSSETMNFVWDKEISFYQHQHQLSQFLLKTVSQAFLPKANDSLPLEFFQSWNAADFEFLQFLIYQLYIKSEFSNSSSNQFSINESKKYGFKMVFDSEHFYIYMHHALRYYTKCNTDFSVLNLKVFLRDTVENSLFFLYSRLMNEFPMFFHQISDFIREMLDFFDSLEILNKTWLNDLTKAVLEDQPPVEVVNHLLSNLIYYHITTNQRQIMPLKPIGFSNI